MLSKNNPQIDILSQMIYDKLVPDDHLLVKIDSIIDFSFVYDKVKDKYSSISGRSSKDPAMMVKIILLEYLYKLSDVEVAKRASTDVVFRWFLKLGIDDITPDDTTISHFRTKRIGKEDFENFFNEIVKMCIEKNIVKTKRYIIDSTDVSANAAFPFGKKLIRDAYSKVIKEIDKFDENLAKQEKDSFEADIDKEYEKAEKVGANKHFEIALKHLADIYVKTYDELQNNEKYLDAYELCYDIADQHLNKKKDKIISIVDKDARAAHKSRGKVKVGYKDHIIVDEDSEIIMASSQTPFNVGDEKKLAELINKVEDNFKIKPEEITADKIYGTTDNRAYLKDNRIVSNIAFYNSPAEKNEVYGIRDFVISGNLESVTCPYGVTTRDFTKTKASEKTPARILFKFDKKYCAECPLRDGCIRKDKTGKHNLSFKRVEVPIRYDAVLHDLKRVETQEFDMAYRKRFKVERRFGTMVNHRGLRRNRYTGLDSSSVHIIMANFASNIVRMVNILCRPVPVAVKA